MAARALLRLVRGDDLDAAIEAGLARFTPCAALSNDENAELAAARDRLLVAWAARERYLARVARLARRAAARKAARAAPPATGAPSADLPAASSTTTGAGTLPASPPALPAAAAAALARARARMAGKP
ncbi:MULTISPECIES: hypothetical protein [unclassified Luteimonas]|uniref:hypothetical protein n=1 Tax=unclassified Luteimonas TaxID=2629088 RepID=UPI0016028817|nr:hypothetical protein [Luteimonas sp. MC1825]MBB1472418.1 hypothetical protein [Luteimonas sp. MC1782]MBB6598870.1 hypothetical protein [Luteimonas sp. MC1825]QOC89481.1 hypothetical protein IDM46_04595 [Luteimonas sp. MC1825]